MVQDQGSIASGEDAMVKPSDLVRAQKKPIKKGRNPEDRRKVRNQPLKGNPELFALKKRLEKENGK